jgi:hypothetical protein
MRKIFTLIFIVMLMGLSATPVRAFDDNTFEAAAADVLVVRPASFIATVLGTAIFVVSLPIAAISGSVEDTAEALVFTPGRATFTRPVGELSTLGD